MISGLLYGCLVSPLLQKTRRHTNCPYGNKGRNSPAPRLLERVFAVIARGFEVAAGAPACVAAGAGAAAYAEEVAGGERVRQVFLALSLRGVGVDASMMMFRVGKICEIFGGELPRGARHRRRRHRPGF